MTLPSRRNYQARPVEDKAVISADLIHHGYGHVMIPCDRRQHVTPQLSLAEPERRSGNVQHKISAGSNQFLHRIDSVKPPVPETLVVPRILANRQSHLLAAKAEQHLAAWRAQNSASRRRRRKSAAASSIA